MNRYLMLSIVALLLANACSPNATMPDTSSPNATTPDKISTVNQADGTQGYRDEIYNDAEPWTGPPRSGAEIYAYRCGSCHAKTTQGAPMPGDDIEWGLRASKGMNVLMQHTIEGYNKLLMPERGGCGNCSDSELKAALIYMLTLSGVEVPPP